MYRYGRSRTGRTLGEPRSHFDMSLDFGFWLPSICSGLINPDTNLGENSRYREVFDEQAKTNVFPRVQAACLVLDKNYSHIEASRSVGVGESVLRRWVSQRMLPASSRHC